MVWGGFNYHAPLRIANLCFTCPLQRGFSHRAPLRIANPCFACLWIIHISSTRPERFQPACTSTHCTPVLCVPPDKYMRFRRGFSWRAPLRIANPCSACLRISIYGSTCEVDVYCQWFSGKLYMYLAHHLDHVRLLHCPSSE